jgi:hypothetical protein
MAGRCDPPWGHALIIGLKRTLAQQRARAPRNWDRLAANQACYPPRPCWGVARPGDHGGHARPRHGPATRTPRHRQTTAHSDAPNSTPSSPTRTQRPGRGATTGEWRRR